MNHYEGFMERIIVSNWSIGKPSSINNQIIWVYQKSDKFYESILINYDEWKINCFGKLHAL